MWIQAHTNWSHLNSIQPRNFRKFYLDVTVTTLRNNNTAVFQGGFQSNWSWMLKALDCCWTRWMHNMEHAHDCHQNVTEPQATEYHKQKYTRAHEVRVRLSYNSYSKAGCTQAGPAHAAIGDGMDRWQHSSHLFLHALLVAFHRAVVRSIVTMSEKKLESSDFNIGTVNQSTKTNGVERLPISYLYRSSH